MKFHLGPKPYAKDFDPDGWTEVPVPSARLVVPLALLMAALCGGVVLGLLYLLAPGCLTLRGYHHWQVLLLFLLTIPTHELVHAVLQPRLGRDTIFGFWPRRLVFYAFYPGPRTRGRTLVGAIGPFLVLSIAPIVLASILGIEWWGISALTVINGCASSNDVLGFFFVLSRIPAGAEVIGQRRRGFYRKTGPGVGLTR